MPASPVSPGHAILASGNLIEDATTARAIGGDGEAQGAGVRPSGDFGDAVPRGVEFEDGVCARFGKAQFNFGGAGLDERPLAPGQQNAPGGVGVASSLALNVGEVREEEPRRFRHGRAVQ